MNRLSRASALAAVTAFALVTAPARAEGPPSSDAVSAQLFFQRGREAAESGQPAEACRYFEESLRLDLAVGTLFNLASCEEALGRVASAWQHLREGVDRLEDSDPRKKPALKSLAALEPRLPRLEVHLAERTTGQVFRDGVELLKLSLGTALPVNPGRHVVTVRAPGRLESKIALDLVEGARRTLVVTPGQPDLRAPAKPPPHSTLRTAGWITAGVGAASLAAGIGVGALAYERSGVVHDNCQGSTCNARGLDALNASQSLGAVSTVTILAGAALVATGVVLVVVGKPREAQATASAMPPAIRF